MGSPQLAKIQFLLILLNYYFNGFLKLKVLININSSNLMQLYLFTVVKGLSHCTSGKEVIFQDLNE